MSKETTLSITWNNFWDQTLISNIWVEKAAYVCRRFPNKFFSKCTEEKYVKSFGKSFSDCLEYFLELVCGHCAWNSDEQSLNWRWKAHHRNFHSRFVVCIGTRFELRSIENTISYSKASDFINVFLQHTIYSNIILVSRICLSAEFLCKEKKIIEWHLRLPWSKMGCWA